jgi:hypothetical protein
MIKAALLALTLFTLQLPALAWQKVAPSTDEHTFDDDYTGSMTGAIFVILDAQGFVMPKFGQDFTFAKYFDPVESTDAPQIGDVASYLATDGTATGGLIIDVNEKSKEVVIKTPLSEHEGQIVSSMSVVQYSDIVWLMRPHAKKGEFKI